MAGRSALDVMVGGVWEMTGWLDLSIARGPSVFGLRDGREGECRSAAERARWAAGLEQVKLMASRQRPVLA